MSILSCVFFLAFFLISLSGCKGKSIEDYIADLSHPAKQVRLKASYKLVLSGAATVEPLLARAASGSDSLQFISAQILGRIGDKRAIPLLRQLGGSPNDFVRREAILALGEMGDLDIGPFLQIALRDDKAPEVRSAAAQSLASLGDTLATQPLIQALQDSTALVRQQAVAALHHLWPPMAAAAVMGALQDQDETVRYIAAQSLGKHRVQPALIPLRAALQDTSFWVRAEAARSLGELGDTGAVEDLVRLLKQGDAPDQQAAREALEKIAGQD